MYNHIPLVCIYAYMHVYMCIYVFNIQQADHGHLSAISSIYIHVYIYIYVMCIYIYIYIYIYNMCVCASCAYVHALFCAHLSATSSLLRFENIANTCVYVYVCVHVCVCVNVYTCICMYVCVYIYIYMHVCMHACIYIYIYTYISNLISEGSGGKALE